MSSLNDIGDEYIDHLKRGAARAKLSPPAFVIPDECWAELNGLNFHYLDWGGPNDLPPLVLLHGGGLNAHTWDLCALMLRSRRRCYALDMRGHGDSDWSKEGEYTLSAYVADIGRFVDYLGLRHFVAVGMSLGGLAAIGFAVQQPSTLDALVVVDAVPRMPQTTSMAPALAEFYRTEVFEDLEHAIAHAMSFNPRRNQASLTFSLKRNLRTLPDGRLTWKADMRRRRQPGGARLSDEASPLWDKSANIVCPTMLVRGAESPLLPADLAQEFVDHLRDGRLATVAHAGHTVQGDNPLGLVEAIQPFIDAVIAAEPSRRPG